MPNNKRHTLKTIKNRDSMHPSSRKAFQLTRVVMRNDRLEQRTRSKETIGNPKIDRWLWFKFALDDSLPCASSEELHSLIDMYLSRNDDELEKLQAQRKDSKRPKSSRQDLLEALIKKEREEYDKGFELPDLQNPKNVKILRAWDGDKNSMARIKTKKVQNPSAIPLAPASVTATTTISSSDAMDTNK
ncbi:translation machinery-associated protein 16 [Umbelopsis sp. PMI_123]|nr:translation machinery-associated protein 16 [Umbelopsis sp. PMI_123]